MSDQTCTSRRSFIKAASAVAVGGTVVGAGTVSADHSSNVPDHVTVTYDESLIEQYQPRMVLGGVEPSPDYFDAVHCSSENHDTACVVGFTVYPYQDGYTGQDSHLGDHEPVYVFYGKDSGEVTRVLYSAWHWFRGTAVGGGVQYGSNGTQPVLEVDDRHHHYRVHGGSRTGDLLPLRDLANTLPGWMSNGGESELAASQPFDPWEMLGRESWWKRTWGNQFDAFGAKMALWFGSPDIDRGRTDL